LKRFASFLTKKIDFESQISSLFDNSTTEITLTLVVIDRFV
jgi:hypothetical protein